MTSKDLIDACDILIKLEQEFSAEEAKLSEVSGEHAMRIDELDQQITTFRRNEDVDFRVFSPRNVSTATSEKITLLETEKKQLEREKKEADKQLRYYAGKTEMIGRVLDLLRGDLKEESEEDSPTVRNSRNPFAFLDEDIEDEVIEDKEDEVAALFRSVKAFDRREASSEDFTVKKQDDEPEVTTEPMVTYEGVPVEDVERICHKVEFCEKIFGNDRIRCKLEIKNIIADLRDLIRAYTK